jgi:catechol 2,3-dioxygenase-like lactoylglutathione lyase family enzyme
VPIIPVVKSSAILRSIAFYTEVLDFQLVGVWPEPADPAFSILTRNGEELHLSSHAGDGAYGGSFTVLTDTIDADFERFRARGLDGSHRPDSPIHQGPTDQTWGTREFVADDPDGNRVCYMQRPPEWSKPAFPAACPEVPVADLEAALADYRDRLGFAVDWSDVALGLCQVSRGSSRFFLATQGFRQAGPIRLWINLDNRAQVDALYAEWTAKGVTVAGPPEPRPWKLHEFTAEDADGNLLRVLYDFGWEERG